MKLFKKLEDLLTAAAFAEAGEFDAAREIAQQSSQSMGSRASVMSVKRGRAKDKSRLASSPPKA